MKKICVLSAVFLTLAGCLKTEPPIDIETYDRRGSYGSNYIEIVITATTDVVEVIDVIVHRGNCKHASNHLPRELNFGESISIKLSGQCSAKQVDVITDLDDWTWQY
jgi:hypothetical protein|tara:strand:- start:32993 stop:33313 length:321 start_codon:yes stop_codon:yes gene_type:complete